MQYFHPSAIPQHVVDMDLEKIEQFLSHYKDSEYTPILGFARGLCYTLRNIYTCGVTDDNPST